MPPFFLLQRAQLLGSSTFPIKMMVPEKRSRITLGPALSIVIPTEVTAAASVRAYVGCRPIRPEPIRGRRSGPPADTERKNHC